MKKSISLPARFLLGALLSAIGPGLQAQQVKQLQELAPSNIDEPNLGFGASVDIFGNSMVVGAAFFSSLESQKGAVYLFERQSGAWTEVQVLLPDDYAVSDYQRYGYTASLYGDFLAVGASEVLERDEPEPWEELGQWTSARGVVFIFEKVAGVWVQAAKLTIDHLTASPNDSLSFSDNLALHGNKLVVASAHAMAQGVWTPTVFVYERQEAGWVLQAQLTPPCAGCGYGRSVDLYEDTIAIGGFRPNEWSDGFVDIYRRIGAEWQHEAQLVPSDGIVGRELGNRVSLHQDSLLAGAIRDDDNGLLSGAAYEFERINGAWVEISKLKPTAGGPTRLFSWDVHHNGETAVISENDQSGSTSNQATVFKKIGAEWSEVALLERFPTDVDGRIGHEVVVSGNLFAVTNYLHAPGAQLGNQGRVWLYSLQVDTDPTTESGQDIEVIPTVAELNGDPIADAPEFNFTFEDIEVAGDTTITVVDPSPTTATPPSGFRVLGFNDGSALFDFHTTATMAAGSTVEICIDYSSMDIDGEPADLIFAHEVEGVWQEITSSNDLGQEIICGVTDSFSYFALIEQADPIQLLDELVQAVAALNAKHGIVNSLDAKLSAAKKALADAKKNNDLSAINVLMHSFISAVEAQRGKQILQVEADHLIELAMGVVAAIEAGG